IPAYHCRRHLPGRLQQGEPRTGLPASCLRGRPGRNVASRDGGVGNESASTGRVPFWADKRMTAQAFSVTIRRAASRTTCLRAMTEEAFETCRRLWQNPAHYASQVEPHYLVDKLKATTKLSVNPRTSTTYSGSTAQSSDHGFWSKEMFVQMNGHVSRSEQLLQ